MTRAEITTPYAKSTLWRCISVLKIGYASAQGSKLPKEGYASAEGSTLQTQTNGYALAQGSKLPNKKICIGPWVENCMDGTDTGRIGYGSATRWRCISALFRGHGSRGFSDPTSLDPRNMKHVLLIFNNRKVKQILNLGGSHKHYH